MRICTEQYISHPGRARDAAALLIARILSRYATIAWLSVCALCSRCSWCTICVFRPDTEHTPIFDDFVQQILHMLSSPMTLEACDSQQQLYRAFGYLASLAALLVYGKQQLMRDLIIGNRLVPLLVEYGFCSVTRSIALALALSLSLSVC
jgi:hypothetical protein